MIKISVITSLYNCEKYLKSFLKYVYNLSNINDIELILIHNEPKINELEIIKFYKQTFINRLNHHIVEKRENLYASWNRGINLAKGKYIAIWNVDDIRTTQSLEMQAITLDNNNDTYFTYGDQIEVMKYGDFIGSNIVYPEYSANPKVFLKRYLCGCFPMWKKEVHSKIGYFDEQFKSAGDFDFCIRLARAFKGKKTQGNLGYYLASSGISKTGRINNTERTLVEIRYGQFYKINFIFLIMALRKYKVFSIRWYNNIYSINDYYDNFIKYWVIRVPYIFIGASVFPLRFLIPTLIKYMKLSRKSA